MKLYEIREELSVLLDSVDFDDDAGKEAIEKMNTAFKDRAGEIIRYALNLKADAEQMKAHCDAITQKREKIEQKSKRILDYVLQQMKMADISEIKDDNALFVAKIAKNPPSVVADLGAIDKNWIKVEQVEKIDKKGIIAHWKETGETPAGCEIVQVERLSIK